MGVGRLVLAVRPGRREPERGPAFAVQEHLQLVRLVQALDVLVAVPRQAELDLILAVPREGVGDQGPASRAERGTFASASPSARAGGSANRNS